MRALFKLFRWGRLIAFNSRSLWDKGYVDVYRTVTQYKPYQEHIQYLISLLELNDHSSLLDLGCGSGELMEAGLEKAGHVTGLDGSMTMLTLAGSKLSRRAVLAQHDLSNPLPFENNSFDRIVSNNVLGYLPNPGLMIDEVTRVLKTGGVFVISTMKKSFKPFAVYREHVKKSSVTSVIKSILPSISVAYYNRRITDAMKTGEYQGFDETIFKSFFADKPVRDISFYDSYSDQDIVVKGFKV